MKIKVSPVKVYRQELSFDPDHSRVITRFFEPSQIRKNNIVRRVLGLSADEVNAILAQTLQNFEDRHRNVKRIFKDNYDKLHLDIDTSLERTLLIGAYFTMEYSIETAALLNPSIVAHPDQRNLKKRSLRVILSFRAVGEGHMSSIVFREGIINSRGKLSILPNGHHLESAKIIQNTLYSKKDISSILRQLQCYDPIEQIMNNLLEEFSYDELMKGVEKFRSKKSLSHECNEAVETLLWLVKSNYEIKFDKELNIAGRVIFPRSKGEIKALEDARFVSFEDNKEQQYFATYTAYDGHNILPEIIETKDFIRFKIMTLVGKGARNKGMALFPEKIKGKYAMISRVDNENLFIMFSDDIYHWEEPVLLKKPTYYWEFYQIGNNGSPLKTEKGWLLLIHGVGPVRTYCIGAILLDLEDPTKVIGMIRDPILFSNEDERDGYVPNVVYSCGSIVHHDYLIMPYAMSDSRSGVAKFQVGELLEHIEPLPQASH
ncbi:glycoside hydrolase family 130 protein [Fulvivirgaceae bacterium BMA10]|uniref:Glycoside hydrolase family 130 protein n=1 Tax=Splendidivirga corallicola TaxID=3051826 RepID=A0ABT8KUS5_9BACT|nr:glycoside hydrolase family 130 protein [Fulvivirgaceae bacterium BMA10]